MVAVSGCVMSSASHVGRVTSSSTRHHHHLHSSSGGQHRVMQVVAGGMGSRAGSARRCSSSGQGAMMRRRRRMKRRSKSRGMATVASGTVTTAVTSGAVTPAPAQAVATRNSVRAREKSWIPSAAMRPPTKSASLISFGSLSSSRRRRVRSCCGSPECDTKAEAEVSSTSAEIAPSCDVNALRTGDFSGCSLKDLEMMYVDAVWSYYKGDKDRMLDNDAYDQLKLELNYQASGMPDLNRREMEFVEASLSYARGKPVMSDDEYEKLKAEVKDFGPKKMDITAMMLTVKGQECLTAEQYAELSEKMLQLGINVGIEGATCTITRTPDDLTPDNTGVLQMYAAIGFLPTLLLGVLPCTALAIITSGGFPSAELGLAWTVASGSALTAFLITYMDLHNTEILVGLCPCCEEEVKLLFAGETRPETEKVKCNNCGATSSMNRTTRKIAAA